MFFIASKIIWFLLTPSNVLLVIILAGAGLAATRWRRIGHAAVFAGALGYLVAGLSPVPNILMQALEDRFPAPDLAETGSVDAIIVLGGATSAPIATARQVMALNEAAERLAVIPALAARYPQARIVLSGGSGALLWETDAEANQMAVLLTSMGVAPDRIVREAQSRNTAENATETFRIIQPDANGRYLLVTSAFHMPRAVGSFRAANWPGVIPYPVDYRTRGREDRLRPMPGMSSGLKRTDTAIREWIGLLAYRLTGRIETFYPAP